MGVDAVALAVALSRLLRPVPLAPTWPHAEDIDKAAEIAAAYPRTYAYLALLGDKQLLFNEERTAFYHQQSLHPLPASTGIQAILCRPELLVEIEAIALFRPNP